MLFPLVFIQMDFSIGAYSLMSGALRLVCACWASCAEINMSGCTEIMSFSLIRFLNVASIKPCFIADSEKCINQNFLSVVENKSSVPISFVKLDFSDDACERNSSGNFSDDLAVITISLGATQAGNRNCWYPSSFGINSKGCVNLTVNGVQCYLLLAIEKTLNSKRTVAKCGCKGVM